MLSSRRNFPSFLSYEKGKSRRLAGMKLIIDFFLNSLFLRGSLQQFDDGEAEIDGCRRAAPGDQRTVSDHVLIEVGSAEVFVHAGEEVYFLPFRYPMRPRIVGLAQIAATGLFCSKKVRMS